MFFTWHFVVVSETRLVSLLERSKEKKTKNDRDRSRHHQQRQECKREEEEKVRRDSKRKYRDCRVSSAGERKRQKDIKNPFGLWFKCRVQLRSETEEGEEVNEDEYCDYDY